MAKNVSTTIVLKVNGKDVENSFRGLSKEVRSLENELKELTPGTERFMRKAAELKEVKEHFSRVKGEIDAVSGRYRTQLWEYPSGVGCCRNQSDSIRTFKDF